MEGNCVFRNGHGPRLYQVAHNGYPSRIIRILESFRVKHIVLCLGTLRTIEVANGYLSYSDFFPVILSFLRRLPIIGPFLNHPIFTKVTSLP